MAIVQANLEVTTSAAEITAGTVTANRTALLVANMGSHTIFVGDSGVTDTDGFPVRSGETRDFPTAMVDQELHAVTSYVTKAGALNIRILESS